MPRQGNGTYLLPQPAFVPGTTIASSPVNSDFSDIAAAISQSISKDGQTVYTGDQPMGGNKLTNLGPGQAAGDSVNLGQVADGSLTYGGVAGGTADALTIVPSPGITAYSIGQMFSFKASVNNTGAVTVNVNGVGAGALTWPDGSALAADDIVAGGMYEIEVQAATPVFHMQTGANVAATQAPGNSTRKIATTAFVSAAVVVGMPPGVVVPYGATSAPTGWLLCSGQAVSRTTYASLFAAVGTAFGVGDGSTTFNVPDMRGRVAAGLDNIGGSAAGRLTTVSPNGNTIGASGGAQTHQLTIGEMPSHNHAQVPSATSLGSSGDPAASQGGGLILGSPTDVRGGDQAHNNVQPTFVLNYIIKT